MLISVVITCYNLSRYIGAAIQSVLDQEYAGEVEVLVIDDFSTDQSCDIIKNFPSVKLVRNKSNMGVLLTTMRGVEAAKGDIVSFLDGDDVWGKTKLSVVAQVFTSDLNLGLHTHDIRFIGPRDEVLKRSSRPAATLSRSSPYNMSDTIRHAILASTDIVWLGSALTIRKSAITWQLFCDHISGIADPLNTYQDWPIACWAAASGAKLAYSKDVLLSYRIHGANYSGDARQLEGVQRNIMRAANTTSVMIDIIRQFCGPGTVFETLNVGKKCYLDCLQALYRGQRQRALKSLVCGRIPYKALGMNRTKEYFRMALLFGIGPNATLAASKFLRRSRDPAGDPN